MDEAIAVAVNKLFSGPYQSSVMILVSDPKSWYAPVAALIFALFIVDKKRAAIAVLVAIFAVSIGDFFAGSIIKPLIARERPCQAVPEIIALMDCGKAFSFPSNHAVNSVAVAAVLSLFFSRLKWPLFAMAGLVLLSRVAVGAHYVTDVLAGAAFGYFVGHGLATAVKSHFIDKTAEERNEI